MTPLTTSSAAPPARHLKARVPHCIHLVVLTIVVCVLGVQSYPVAQARSQLSSTVCCTTLFLYKKHTLPKTILSQMFGFVLKCNFIYQPSINNCFKSMNCFSHYTIGT